jgi:hypothetical protein
MLRSGYNGPGTLSNGSFARTRLLLLRATAGMIAALAVLAAAPKARARAEAKPPLDFSGTWTLDPKMSSNVSSRMQGAVLFVRQTGDRIWISPVKPEEGTRQRILAEEIVADAHPYEKALGPAVNGLVTAGWAKDGKSLWIEVKAGPSEEPGSAIQRSVWRLSEDRQIWVRETVSASPGRSERARLVFRRTKG